MEECYSGKFPFRYNLVAYLNFCIMIETVLGRPANVDETLDKKKKPLHPPPPHVTATGLVDGIYADHSCEKGVGIGTAFPTKDNGPNQLCNGVAQKRKCYNFTQNVADSWKPRQHRQFSLLVLVLW